jgi:hypothetical protein
MAKLAKFLQAVAGAAGGAGLDVDDVFSTFLYDGTGATQTITNNIDLSGEGGLVWTKRRDSSGDHVLYDTERGVSGNDALRANTNGAAFSGSMSSFNNNGFTLDSNTASNTSGAEMLSFSFRKAENFFTIVEWTGNGNSTQTIAHDLGATPDLIITKNKTFGSGVISWWTPTRRRFQLDHENASNAAATYDEGSVTSRDSTNFYVSLQGSGYSAGRNGDTFVSYLFAGHDGDGTFGADSDQDIVKIGQYTGDGTTDGSNTINLGFEPQLLFIKNISDSQEPRMFNNMSGFGVDKSVAVRYTDTTAESTINVCTTSTGFALKNSSTGVNANGNLYAYFAIRRGPLAEPTSATDVFAIATRDGTEPSFDSSFPVDFALTRTVNTADNWWAASRLNQGNYLQTNRTNAEASASSLQFDYMDGWNSNTGANSNLYAWMWKRAPSYFDVVCYDGDATSAGQSRTISHNLGAVPEMMWIKCRSFAENWAVYHSGIGATKYLNLNGTAAAATSGNWWRNTAPTDSVFTIGHQDDVNANGETHIAYLFATVAGVSKVGSFSHTFGSATNVDCGFSNGSRFVLLKRTDSTGNWEVYDTERGLVSGNDSLLRLNTTDDQSVGHDAIDPLSSGFSIPSSGLDTGNYIFYAIA